MIDTRDMEITDITNGEIINGEWIGTGVFDKLIHAVGKNIEIQFDADRIVGSEYANVYLGSMQTVITQSMQYVLQETMTEAQVAEMDEKVRILKNQT